MSIQDTLNERQSTHGDFAENASLSQTIKEYMHTSKNWRLRKLTATQEEALDMIALKISRILTGNNREPDHWRDIAGYATLAENELVDKASDSDVIIS